MNAPAFNIQAAIQQAAQQGPDMTKEAAGGGGDYEPPAKGLCVATLIGYIELGVHESEWQGQKKRKEKVQLIFELAGGKNNPKTLDDGTKIPHRITITETKSLSAKANFFKLFQAMNFDGTARHFAELLDRHFLCDVSHDERGEGSNKRVYASLRTDSGYTLRAPLVQQGDVLAGDVTAVPVPKPPRVSDLRLFLWDFPSKEMWDSLFIDGEYEAKPAADGRPALPAKSKNVIQNKIKEALNWNGSPMQEILSAGGELNLDPLATPAAAAPATAPAAVTETTPAPTPEAAPAASPTTAVSAEGAAADPLAGLI